MLRACDCCYGRQVPTPIILSDRGVNLHQCWSCTRISRRGVSLDVPQFNSFITFEDSLHPFLGRLDASGKLFIHGAGVEGILYPRDRYPPKRPVLSYGSESPNATQVLYNSLQSLVLLLCGSSFSPGNCNTELKCQETVKNCHQTLGVCCLKNGRGRGLLEQTVQTDVAELPYPIAHGGWLCSSLVVRRISTPV